jgi:hypothetical protein
VVPTAEAAGEQVEIDAEVQPFVSLSQMEVGSVDKDLDRRTMRMNVTALSGLMMG